MGSACELERTALSPVLRRWFTIEKLAGPIRGDETASAGAVGDGAPDGDGAAATGQQAARQRNGQAAKEDIGRDTDEDMGVRRRPPELCRSREAPCVVWSAIFTKRSARAPMARHRCFAFE